jgi:hypothetical protein
MLGKWLRLCWRVVLATCLLELLAGCGAEPRYSAFTGIVKTCTTSAYLDSTLVCGQGHDSNGRVVWCDSTTAEGYYHVLFEWNGDPSIEVTVSLDRLHFEPYETTLVLYDFSKGDDPQISPTNFCLSGQR